MKTTILTSFLALLLAFRAGGETPVLSPTTLLLTEDSEAAAASPYTYDDPTEAFRAVMKTLIKRIFIIAFTSVSVPSEPTALMFSVQPVELSFSSILNFRVKVCSRGNLLSYGECVRASVNDLRYFIESRDTSSCSSPEKRLSSPISY